MINTSKVLAVCIIVICTARFNVASEQSLRFTRSNVVLSPSDGDAEKLYSEVDRIIASEPPVSLSSLASKPPASLTRFASISQTPSLKPSEPPVMHSRFASISQTPPSLKTSLPNVMLKSAINSVDPTRFVGVRANAKCESVDEEEVCGETHVKDDAKINEECSSSTCGPADRDTCCKEKDASTMTQQQSSGVPQAGSAPGHCCKSFKDQGYPLWSMSKEVFSSVSDEDKQRCCENALSLAIDKIVEEDAESAPGKCRWFIFEIENHMMSHDLDETGRENVFKKVAMAMKLDSADDLDRLLAVSASADAEVVKQRLKNGKGNGFVQDVETYLREQIKVIEGQIEGLQKNKALWESYLSDKSKIEKLQKDMTTQYEIDVKRKGQPSTVLVEAFMRNLNFLLGPVTKEEKDKYYPHKHDVGSRVVHVGDGWSEGVIHQKNDDGTYEVVFSHIKEDEIREGSKTSSGSSGSETSGSETSTSSSGSSGFETSTISGSSGSEASTINRSSGSETSTSSGSGGSETSMISESSGSETSTSNDDEYEWARN